MSDLSLAEENNGTNLRNFMAHRGAIIVKEMRNIGKFAAEYNNQLEIETLILRMVREKKDNVVYGVVLKHIDENGRDEAAVNLDFDEVDELVSAIDFIKKTSSELLGTQRDYTEVIYATKDNARIGFFQNLGSQTAFISLSTHSSIFLNILKIGDIQDLLRKAKNHLVSSGAEVVCA
jgi:hypothetical protein